jgi:hypothetical protein
VTSPELARAGAGPRDQFGLEDEAAVLVLVRPADLIEQEFRDGPALADQRTPRGTW